MHRWTPAVTELPGIGHLLQRRSRKPAGEPHHAPRRSRSALSGKQTLPFIKHAAQQADPITQDGEAVVRVGGWHLFAARQQVQLITGVDERPSDLVSEKRLPALDLVQS